MKKYSRQRELIIENLRQRRDHPTAEKLYLDLKEKMPEIGIATVYRNLTELCKQGIITKVKSKTGPDRYDGNEKAHIHFECNRCEEIIDIYLKKEESEQMDKVIQKIVGKKDIEFENAEICLAGLCGKCKKHTKSIAL